MKGNDTGFPANFYVIVRTARPTFDWHRFRVARRATSAVECAIAHPVEPALWPVSAAWSFLLAEFGGVPAAVARVVVGTGRGTPPQPVFPGTSKR
jgi:hypothetical protein